MNIRVADVILAQEHRNADGDHHKTKPRKQNLSINGFTQFCTDESTDNA